MPRLNPFARSRTVLTKVWQASIDGHVVALDWSTAHGLIAAGSADGPILLIDVKSGSVRHALQGHGFGTADVAWSMDGIHLASAGQDGKVRLWDAVTGRTVHDMPGGADWVERVAWCPTKNFIASAAGKKLRLWDPKGEMIREYEDHPGTIADLQWKPGEALLASTSYGKLFLWNLDNSRSTLEFKWQGSMLRLAWSPNGKYIAAGAQDCSVHFWLLATGEDLQMTGYPTKVQELSWDEHSRYLATGGGTVPCVWDTSGTGPEGTQPLQFEAHKDMVHCLTFQSQGTLLASGGDDGLVALWQPGKQQGAIGLARHTSAVSQLRWSPDQHQLVVGTASGDVILYTTR